MLTEAILKQNAVLDGLTPEQIAAITTLSQNDEGQIIANKYGELYGSFDNLVKEVVGVEKEKGQKTTEFVKAQLLALKEKAEKAGDNTELEKMKSELEQARKDLKDNAGDRMLKGEVERLAKEVADEKQRVKDLQQSINTTTQEWEKKVMAEQEKLQRLKIDNEANKALSGIKFKDEKLIPAQLREIAIEAAKAKVLSENKVDWVDDGRGGQVQVFRDKTGQIRNNPDNLLQPFTFAELLAKELTHVIDTGHHQAGAGTKDGKGQAGKGGMSLDFTGVRTKTEAGDRFNQHWLKVVGKTMTDPDYNKEYQAAMKELPANLPLA
jgi:gas vesicle protein